MRSTPQISLQLGGNLRRYIMKRLRRRGGPHAQDVQALAVVGVFYCLLAENLGPNAAAAELPGYLAELDAAMETRHKFRGFKAASSHNRTLVRMLGQAMDETAKEIYPPTLPGTLSIDKDSEGSDDGQSHRLDLQGLATDDPAFQAAVNDQRFIEKVTAMTAALSEQYGKLASKHREVLELIAIEGKTIRGAAAELGRPHTTVQGQLDRAKHLLIKSLTGVRELYEQSTEAR
jgi:hypothetical protein